ncbi:MAG: hypothetical protein IPJ34_04890 [Myxococcales bacterium]|nr:hypothetical protein [Myxococcales bacterium]
MRSLRLSFVTLGSGLPALVGVALLPGCGATTTTTVDADCVTVDSTADSATGEVEFDLGVDDTVSDVSTNPCRYYGEPAIKMVSLPAPGTPADPGLICAVSATPVESSAAARVSLTSAGPDSAVGVVAITPGLSVVGTPVITVTTVRSYLRGRRSPTSPRSAAGFASTSPGPSRFPGYHTESWSADLQFTVSFSLACEAGTRAVESITNVDRCIDGDQIVWRSSGDACVECRVIAEMAPSPIVSDNQGDDLPLGRVLQVRVVEVARASNGVLLFAENDAGEQARYEWHVSGGVLRRLAEDLVFWAPPPGDSFGQVALWNDAGAVVENFLHARVPA